MALARVSRITSCAPASCNAMARGKYEDSAADKANDRKQAKKRGVSVKKFENSPADKRMDIAGQKKLDAKAKKGKR